MFTEQINEFIDQHNLPLALTLETSPGENSFYHSIFQLLMLHKNQLPSIDLKLSDLTPRSLKFALIKHRKSIVTNDDDVICENCKNICKTGSEHLRYLSLPKVPADEVIFQTIPSFLNVSLCLVFPEFRPQYFSNDDSSRLVFYLFNIPGVHFQALVPNAPNTILHIILSNFNPIKIRERNSIKHVSFLCSSCKCPIIQDDVVKICRDCRKEFHKENCFRNHECSQLNTTRNHDDELISREGNKTAKPVKKPEVTNEKRKIKDSVLDQIWKTQKSVVIFKKFFVSCITNQNFNITSIPAIKQVDYLLKSASK